MAVSLGSLFVELGADTSPLKKSEKEVKTFSQKVEAQFNKLGGVIAGAITIETARRVALIADRMTRLEGTVRRLTKTTGDFEKVWGRIADISNDNGAAIQDTTSLFQRFQMTMDKITDSNDDILNFVDTLQKIGRLGGSSAEEMSNALVQLSQGFASGIIRAEEFSSVSEQMPFLLKIAADNIEGLNGDIGKLRAAMLDGQLTADTFYKAIKRGSEGINDEFEDLPGTIDLATQKLNNNLSIAISNLDKKIGASENIANFISSMAELIELLSSSGAELDAAAKGVDGVSTAMVSTDARIKSLKMTIKDLESAMDGDSFADGIVRFFEGDDLEGNLAQARKDLEKEIALYKTLEKRMISELGKGVGIEDASAIGGESPAESATETPMATLGGGGVDEKEVKRRQKIREREQEAANEMLDAIYLASLNQKDRLLALEQQQLEQIMDAYDKGYIRSYAEYQSAITQTGEDFAKQRAEIEKENVEEINAAYVALGNSIGDALGGALAQTQSWSDAMRSIISNLASQLITAGITSAFGGSVGGGNVFSGLFSGGGRAMGGPTSGMLAHPINERGVPETYTQNGKQYLLPTGQSGQIQPLQQQQGGGVPPISMINMGTPMEVEGVQVTNGEIQVMINNAINKYNRGLMGDVRQGKGEFGKAFPAGFKAQRNLGNK